MLRYLLASLIVANVNSLKALDVEAKIGNRSTALTSRLAGDWEVCFFSDKLGENRHGYLLQAELSNSAHFSLYQDSGPANGILSCSISQNAKNYRFLKVHDVNLRSNNLLTPFPKLAHSNKDTFSMSNFAVSKATSTRPRNSEVIITKAFTGLSSYSAARWEICFIQCKRDKSQSDAARSDLNFAHFAQTPRLFPELFFSVTRDGAKYIYKKTLNIHSYGYLTSISNHSSYEYFGESATFFGKVSPNYYWTNTDCGSISNPTNAGANRKSEAQLFRPSIELIMNNETEIDYTKCYCYNQEIIFSPSFFSYSFQEHKLGCCAKFDMASCSQRERILPTQKTVTPQNEDINATNTANDQCMIEKVSYALNEQTGQQMELPTKHCELVKLDNTSEFFPLSPYFSYDCNATEWNVLNMIVIEEIVPRL